jgi:PD-(D/E)XK endonuclease
MNSSTRAKGNRTEARLLAALLDIYDTVLLPYGGNCRYDLAVETPEGFKRIQCKTGRLRDGGVRFNTSSSTMHRHNGSRKTYHGEADFFGVWCAELDTCYLVPVEECGGVQSTLRIADSRNGQAAGIRWAKEYEIRSPGPESNGGLLPYEGGALAN